MSLGHGQHYLGSWNPGIQEEDGVRVENKKANINAWIWLVTEPFFRTASFLIYPKLLFTTGVDQVMEAPSP